MQTYASQGNHLLSAFEAEKRKNYYCPECGGLVRVRGGDQRQPHFFHLRLAPSCRQSQKGLIHLRMQHFIHSLLQKEEPVIEKIFPEIGRIADVACLKTKKIFEIQYSPMSLEEAKARCHDYEGIGFQVIWILHDHTFNKKRVSSSEQFLRTKTCYFSNMDEKGQGIIYDQFDTFLGRRRTLKGGAKKIDLTQPKLWPPCSRWPFSFVEKRAKSWPLYHEGDLGDLALKGALSSQMEKALPKKNFLKEAYLTWFYRLLERSSR